MSAFSTVKAVFVMPFIPLFFSHLVLFPEHKRLLVNGRVFLVKIKNKKYKINILPDLVLSGTDDLFLNKINENKFV